MSGVESMSTWFTGLEAPADGGPGTETVAFAEPLGAGLSAVTTANTAYQAALRTTASIRQRSLLDFLR